MTKLTDDDVRHLANLAKISLGNDEVTLFSTQLSDILRYVEQLNSEDTKDIKPTNQVTGLTDVFRNDTDQTDTIERSIILEQTPKSEDGFIKVKRVL